MLWEHAANRRQGGVFKPFSSSPLLSRVFLKLDINTENKFTFSFLKYYDVKKKTTCLF